MPAKKTAVPPGPPSPETIEHVFAAIQTSAEPVTAAQISKLLVAPHKLSEAKLTPILDEFVNASRLKMYSAKTAKGKPRYWDRGVNDLARSLILGAIAKKGPLARPALKTACKQVPESAFEEAMRQLRTADGLYLHPPLGKKKELFGTVPPSPEPYLKDVGLQLAKTVEQLADAKVATSAIRRCVLELVESAGVSLLASGVSEPHRPPPTHVDLLTLMRRIEPGAENGALVAARDLRRAAGIEKSQFDQTVLDLARQGRLMLHRHDFAAGISESDRDELVTDGHGTYYVGMALRRAPAD